MSRTITCFFAAASFALLHTACSEQDGEPATLIVNARIVDGTGAPAETGAVRMFGGYISEVGDLTPTDADTVIDAGELVLAPGFVDTHSHHDIGLLDDREATAALTQGITTIVVGQDGRSNLPLADFFERLEETPASINVASYVGHGTIRDKVMGEDFKRAATADEIEGMRRLLAEEMAAGAIGLATGLEYDPGIYSSREEVLTLARETGKQGGRYISHMRSEDVGLDDAIEELLDIGRKVGLPVQISHFKVALVDRWGTAPGLLQRLDAARAEGINVTADAYPYEYWQSTMTVLFPKRDFDRRESAEFALAHLAPPDGMRLSAFAPDPSLVGKTIADISEMRGTDPARTYMDLIREARAYEEAHADDGERVESVIGTSMHPDDIAALIAWPHTNICSDGALHGLHPRGAGAFTKVLRQYVREEGLLTLEEAVHKMTGLAAEHMGFSDRGTIKPGQRADLVLFDPETISDQATIETPHATSVGIKAVWVNGKVVLEDDRPTGAYPGHVIRSRVSRHDARGCCSEKDHGQ